MDESSCCCQGLIIEIIISLQKYLPKERVSKVSHSKYCDIWTVNEKIWQPLVLPTDGAQPQVDLCGVRLREKMRFQGLASCYGPPGHGRVTKEVGNTIKEGEMGLNEPGEGKGRMHRKMSKKKGRESEREGGKEGEKNKNVVALNSARISEPKHSVVSAQSYSDLHFSRADVRCLLLRTLLPSPIAVFRRKGANVWQMGDRKAIHKGGHWSPPRMRARELTFTSATRDPAASCLTSIRGLHQYIFFSRSGSWRF